MIGFQNTPTDGQVIRVEDRKRVVSHVNSILYSDEYWLDSESDRVSLLVHYWRDYLSEPKNLEAMLSHPDNFSLIHRELELPVPVWFTERYYSDVHYRETVDLRGWRSRARL